MPIFIKDFSWRQTDELIILRVPLKGVCLKKIDIFTSDKYLKIHSPPFLFEICLWHAVEEEKSTCTLENGEAVFQLVKQQTGPWPVLTADLSRQEMLAVKIKAIEEAQANAEKKREEIKVKKSERQRAAVKEAISLNTQEQNSIEQTKQQTKADALKDLGLSLAFTKHRSPLTITEIPHTENKHTLLKKEDTSIFKLNKTDSSSLIPGPRVASQIPVSFTPRLFPTPCRESHLAEEQEWLAKQAEARRKTGFAAEDLRPEEQDPVWLCDKAQGFYDVGNYLGAISAYSHALTLNNQLYELYAGRAAAHLAVGNIHRAVSDSTKALELLTPHVPQNAEARARCLLTRGTALNSLGFIKEALGELKAAECLRPNDPDIKVVLSQINI